MKNPIVGFVGVGAMGGPMTRQLAAAGYSLRVFDSDAAILDGLEGTPNVEHGGSLSDVVAGSDIVLSCLPNDQVVGAVYLGDDGIGAFGRQGMTSVDFSTVSPGISQEVHGAFQGLGMNHLDAAMLGSVTQAETGSIGFMVGGEAAAYERVLPLLEVMGKMVRHVGPSGAANRMKLIHQTLVAGHAVAVAEALALCLMTDTDIETFYDIVCQGGGFAHSRYFENRVPRMRAGDFSPLFMLQFMLKDARLAAKLVGDSENKLPVLTQVVRTLEEAMESGWGREDFSAVVHALEKRAGKSLDSDLPD